MFNIRAIYLSLFMVIFAVETMAQNNISSHNINVVMPEVALLGLVSDNSNTVEISANSPVEAGNSIHFTNQNQQKDIWINYSSIIRNQQQKRKIVAFIQGEMPEGMQLLVEASQPEGTGKGKLGHSNGTVALSQQPSEVISDIGSCYTGKGANNGHFLSYKIKYNQTSNSYTSLNTGQSPVQVIYTLTDNN